MIINQNLHKQVMNHVVVAFPSDPFGIQNHQFKVKYAIYNS